ncbi:unnamed protein product [Toxocara canis]|uniref:Pepsin-I3 domain-containing protein n=1 Tax=Toxocara canis TaxID=6265 RepID=A0A183TXN1_TOXCA|nr:unnamed protein product [Toxocara canis]
MMLFFILTLICVASSIDAFFFSSSSYIEIKNDNDGELIVNNVSRGNLTTEQQKELELYNKAVADWSKWWITKVFEGFGNVLSSIFGSDGALWHGFGLWGNKKDNEANMTISTLPPPTENSQQFPEPPSFCQQ